MREPRPTAPTDDLRCFRPDAQKPERLRPAWDDSAAADPAVELRAAAVHGAFRAFVLDANYPCVGAKSAVNNGSYRLGLYPDLGSPESTALLSADLERFASSVDDIDAAFATFVATFERPMDLTPLQFEERLWSQLQGLHDADARRHDWDEAVSSDPDDAHFSFSFAGKAFFVVGLHAGSGRISRQFPWPALVFNPHSQFARLKADGKYARMQQVIRSKEQALQGDINPVLRDFGDGSEARQYSGRPVEDDWRAPFTPHTGDGVAGRSLADRDPDVVADKPHGLNGSGDASRCPFHRAMRALGFGRDVATRKEARPDR